MPNTSHSSGSLDLFSGSFPFSRANLGFVLGSFPLFSGSFLMSECKEIRHPTSLTRSESVYYENQTRFNSRVRSAFFIFFPASHPAFPLPRRSKDLPCSVACPIRGSYSPMECGDLSPLCRSSSPRSQCKTTPYKKAKPPGRRERSRKRHWPLRRDHVVSPVAMQLHYMRKNLCTLSDCRYYVNTILSTHDSPPPACTPCSRESHSRTRRCSHATSALEGHAPSWPPSLSPPPPPLRSAAAPPVVTPRSSAMALATAEALSASGATCPPPAGVSVVPTVPL